MLLAPSRVSRVLVVVVAFTMSSALLVGLGTPADAQVRGFDGTTITVAGVGIASQLPNGPVGAEARFKRFNDTNEIKGIKIKTAEFAEDQRDPATSLSIARRLVTQTGVFAIVPNMSASTPAEYLTQQKVPWFGGGFDDSYCSPKPSTKLWGFGPSGCQTSGINPSFVTDQAHSAYTEIAKQTGKKHPTAASMGTDTEAGKSINAGFEVLATGTGFKVVGTYPIVPLTVSDWTPYVEKLLTADNGNPPDAISCTMAAQCIPLYNGLKARNYQGLFWSGLYAEQLIKLMPGAYAVVMFADVNTPSPVVDQMRADMDAYKAGSAENLDFGAVMGYGAADMFITALKKVVASKGKGGVTPENVQKVASTMQWQLPGFMKTSYPKTTTMTYPLCSSFLHIDGGKWQQAQPWTCSTKTYPVKRSGT